MHISNNSPRAAKVANYIYMVTYDGAASLSGCDFVRVERFRVSSRKSGNLWPSSKLGVG